MVNEAQTVTRNVSFFKRLESGQEKGQKIDVDGKADEVISETIQGDERNVTEKGMRRSVREKKSSDWGSMIHEEQFYYLLKKLNLL